MDASFTAGSQALWNKDTCFVFRASGGPISLDVSGAEYYDTILDIAPSPLDPGVIWVGTDDGLIQLTRDSGAHWTDVTPPQLGPWAKVSIIEASRFVLRTAYAAINTLRLDDLSLMIAWIVSVAGIATVLSGRGTDRRLERMRYAMSLFVVYFGTDRTYPHLPHHSIILGPRYEGLLGDIFDRKVVAEDFSLYLHTPTRTDPSLAPPGCEGFYVLRPVPHLGGGQDWDAIADDYAEAILASLEKEHLVPDLRKHLVTKRVFTPKHFETDLDAYLGSAFQFEPILTQSAWFRPHNKSEDVDGLFFVGAGTHPGAGLPGVISSAKVLERFL